MLLHASCVAIAGKGVLLSGPPGVGKSDLALRLIDRGAQLIADDQTLLQIEDGILVASAPNTIAGLIEIRHVGLVKVPYAVAAPVALFIDLSGTDEVLERMPREQSVNLLDQPVKRLRLPAFAASTPAKIRATLLYPSLSGNA